MRCERDNEIERGNCMSSCGMKVMAWVLPTVGRAQAAPLPRILCALLFPLLLLAVPAQAARLALVIGNDGYTHVERLKNARADAKAMAKALKQAGFEVDLAEDQDRAGINRALRKFRQKISGGDEVVFFYAGHGVELSGSNYLLPVDIKAEDEDHIQDDSISLQELLDELQTRHPAFSLAIIDACRDNPLKGVGRNIGTRGLKPVTAATGQMVIYSAGAGQKALDRLGDDDPSPNGVFTRVFVEAMLEGSEPVQLTMARVRNEVSRLANSVGRTQVPALYDQSLGEFMFVSSGVTPRTKGNGARPPAGDPDERLWQEAKTSDSVEGYDAYLEAYPKGKYVKFAQAAKKKLEAAERAKADTDRKAAAEKQAADSDTGSKEKGAYESAMRLRTREALLAYLKAYPRGDYRSMAQAALESLEEGGSDSGGAKRDDRAPARAAGSTFRDCGECAEMVVIPAGRFEMGSPAGETGRSADEGPVHSVDVRSFALGKHEVTRGEFRRFVRDTGRQVSGCYEYDGKEWKLNGSKGWENPGYSQSDDHPVVCVSWDDAQAYVQWLSRRSGQSYRLSTEAEWEYAARAGARGMRYWGDGEREACQYSNVADQAAKRKNSGWTIFDCDDGYGETAPVGSYRENGFRLKDMLGNVWEWTEDCWHENYDGAPTNESAWTTGGDCSRRVVRGGVWGFGPAYVRLAKRNWIPSTFRFNYLGFRLARTLP